MLSKSYSGKLLEGWRGVGVALVRARTHREQSVILILSMANPLSHREKKTNKNARLGDAQKFPSRRYYYTLNLDKGETNIYIYILLLLYP